jgi:hypothetical protein
MKILKYIEFVTEGVLHDTPKDYIESVLSKLKSKLDLLFLEDKDTKQAAKNKIQKKEEGSGPSLKEMGVKLESSEINKSTLYDSLKIKFSDGNGIYDLNVTINFEDAVPKPDKAFDISDIKKCFIKFKKYDIETFDMLGQVSKNVNINDINEDMIIKLKIEVEKDFGDNQKEVDIELKKD